MHAKQQDSSYQVHVRQENSKISQIPSTGQTRSGVGLESRAVLGPEP